MIILIKTCIFVGGIPLATFDEAIIVDLGLVTAASQKKFLQSSGGLLWGRIEAERKKLHKLVLLRGQRVEMEVSTVLGVAQGRWMVEISWLKSLNG